MNASGNKILFVGDLNPYGRSFQRFRTFQEMGNDVTGITTVPVPFRPGIETSGLMERILWKLKIPHDRVRANAKIRDAVRNGSFDIVWIEKGVTIRPATLQEVRRALPKALLIFCSEDDMYAVHNRTRFFDHGLHYYDMVFTTKVYNLKELRDLGAEETTLFLDAYDEKVHRPHVLSLDERAEYGCDVSFIGSFEGDRAARILYLAEHGVRIVVWGTGWASWLGKHPNIYIKNKMLLEDEYAKAICGTKINLCFLRKINRDEVTSRSVEIPACGGFMLGERTKRHLEFFVEGKEAEFFDSNEELLTKTQYYLVHEDERTRIAAAGRARCLSSGYSVRAQLTNMLAALRAR